MALFSLRRAYAPVAATLALALAFTGLSVATAPAAEAAPAPAFDCTEPRFFAQAGSTSSTQLYTGNYNAQGNSVWTPLGSAKSGTELYNALAFNTGDEHLYGTRFSGTGPGSFLRINRDGTVTQLGNSSPALGSSYNTLWDSGEFDEAGNYYVASGNAGFTGANSTPSIHKVSGLALTTSASSTPRPTLETITLATITPKPFFADFALKEGFLWAASYAQSPTIYRIDINNVLGNGPGAITPFTVAGVLPVNAYGSAFTMTNGNLAFIATNGFMYQVSVANAASPSPQFELVSSVAAPANSASDATNCATALESSLSVTKTGPATVFVGETITWTVTVKNDGPGITSGFVLKDMLPTGLSDVSVQSTDSNCVLNGARSLATCNGGRLAVGQSAVVLVSATAPLRPGPLLNSAQAIGNEDPAPDAPVTAETDVILRTQANQPASLEEPSATGHDAMSVAGGQVAYSGGVFTYTPAPGFSGNDSFTYTVAGGTVTVNIVVSPLATDDATTTAAGNSVTVSGAALVAAGTGSGLSLTSVGPATGGTVSLEGGDPVFVPAPGFSGAAAFQYTLTDADGGTATGTVSVTVTPLAGPGVASTPANMGVTIPAADLVVAGTGTGLTVSSVGPAVNGTVSLVDGDPRFVPTAGFSGTGSFDYTVTDADGGTAAATVTVTVTPVAGNDTMSTPVNVEVPISVLANDIGSDLAITGFSQPASGSVTRDGNAFVFTPAPDVSGTSTFTYTVTDAGGQETTATVTVTVTPLAADDATTTNAGEAVTVPAAGLVSAGTGTGLTVTSVGPAVNGTVSLIDGNPVFLPTPGFSGAASFTYTVTDGAGSTATGIVAVTVVPVAVADSETTPTNSSVTIDVLGNDLGTDLAITDVSAPSIGTASIDDGEIVYAPVAGFSGVVSFTYEVTDASSQTSTATVTVTVTPVAVADSETTDAGVPVTIDVLGNDRGSDLTITSVAAPSSGSAVLNNGAIDYVPADGFSGVVTFTYEVTDSSSQVATGTVTVTVAPAVTGTTRFTPANTAVHIPAADLEATGTGTGLALTSVGAAANGSVAIVVGEAIFTPDDGFSGTGSFTYTLTDDDGGTVTGTVTVTVTPTVLGESTSTPANTDAVVTAADLEASGTGTGLELTAVGNPVNGTVVLDGGDAVFTPTNGFSGSASFEYTLTDDEGNDVTVTVVVTVVPVATGDAFTTPIDTPFGFNVMSNDIGIGLSVALDNPTVNGTIALDADGTASYTPTPGFSGLDSFTYVLTGDGGTSTATVAILVTPLAPDDLAVTNAGQAVDIDVLANDTGVDLVITGTSVPTAGGAVTVIPGGIRYVPAPGFSGIDTFTYTVEDSSGTSATATVTVHVAPLAPPTSSTGRAGEPITIDVVGNGTGTGLTVTAVVRPQHGTAVVNPNGTITFTPNPGFSGTQVIEYTLVDADGLTVDGTVTLTVLPSAVNDEARVLSGHPVTIATLANDIGTGITVTATTRPAGGTVTINADGTITYVSNAGFFGTDTFTYTVTDAAGGTATATVTVLVVPALAVTGSSPAALALLAALLLALGGLGFVAGRRRLGTGRRAA